MNSLSPAATDPYTPPASNPLPALRKSAYNPWAARIEGKVLVVPLGWEAPNLCLVTGQKTNLLNRERKQLAWHNPVLALGILAGLLPYLILAAVFAKKGLITYRLSREARTRQRQIAAVKWCACLLPLLATIPLLGLGNLRAALLMLALSLAAMLCSCVFGQFLPVKRITGQHIHLLGIPDEVKRLIVQAEALH